MSTIISLLIFLYSVILHEIAHGWLANRLGDPTARLQKRLTLNPLPHIDLWMSIVFPLLLMFSGSPIIFGSAKPVPIDAYNLRNPRKDMGLIGLAGPITNLLIASFLALLIRLPFFNGTPDWLTIGIISGIQINVVLAIFNLIPLPPLDGSRVLSAVLPENYATALNSLERYGLFIIIFLLLFPSPFLSLQGIISRFAGIILTILLPSPMSIV